MWRLWSIRTLIVLLWIFQPAFTTCFTSLAIKGSLEECSFHYATDGQSCSEYRFTHSLHVNTTVTKWLWIVSGETKKEMVREDKLGECAKVCCKDESPLPMALESYELCQHRKFLKEVHQPKIFQTAFQISIVLFLMSLVASFFYTFFQAAEECFFHLRDNPQEIQMRMM